MTTFTHSGSVHQYKTSGKKQLPNYPTSLTTTSHNAPFPVWWSRRSINSKQIRTPLLVALILTKKTIEIRIGIRIHNEIIYNNTAQLEKQEKDHHCHRRNQQTRGREGKRRDKNNKNTKPALKLLFPIFFIYVLCFRVLILSYSSTG